MMKDNPNSIIEREVIELKAKLWELGFTAKDTDIADRFEQSLTRVQAETEYKTRVETIKSCQKALQDMLIELPEHQPDFVPNNKVYVEESALKILTNLDKDE